MYSYKQYLLLLLLLQLVILSVLVISADARPCKTIFISSYSFSFKQNPSSSGVLTVVTEISRFNPSTTFDRAFPSDVFIFPAENEVRHDMAFGLGLKKSLSSSYDFSSLRDRTKDILRVVLALLFGVGCGALTSATLYLARSLFSNCFYDLRYGSSYSVENDHHEDNEFSPKKMGYMKIPASNSVPAPASPLPRPSKWHESA